MSPYLIPLHWIQYFSLGLLIQQSQSNYGKRILESKYKLIVPIAFIVVIALMAVKEFRLSYWGFPDPLIGLLGSSSVFIIASKSHGKLLTAGALVGKQSLFIYLWHMPIAGIIANIMNYGSMQYFVILRPFIVLGIMYITVLILAKTKALKMQEMLRIIGLVV